MKKRKTLISLALAAVMAFSAQGPALLAAEADTASSATTLQEGQKEVRKGGRGNKEKVAEPEGAIGKDTAKKNALSDAGVTEEQAGKVMSRVSKLEDGTVVYKIHFTYNNQRYSYKINATTGVVADKSTKAVTENDAKKAKGNGKHGKKEEVAEPEGAIGKDTAKKNALSDAGVTEEQAGKVMSRVSKLEDGTVVYKVHFTYNSQRYSYKINATTGAVADKSTKAASENDLKGSKRNRQP